MPDYNISDTARKLAAKHTIDLADVTPTGADDLIKVEDVEAAVEARAASVPPIVAPDADASAPTPLEAEIPQERRAAGSPKPSAQADTQRSPVVRTVTNAATVGPKTDLLVTTALDAGLDEFDDEAMDEATASGDLVEVLAPNEEFSGVRGGVRFAQGKGLATAEQAGRLVVDFGYSAPALG
jgi:pyruvate/2-oxoglutarate dehydrogenase complex dihydrolipoamide acyltransferase (E2) component